MRRLRAFIALTVLLATVAPVARAVPPGPLTCDGPVSASVTADAVRLQNGCVARVWARDALATTSITDTRTGETLSTRHADFALALDGVRIPSDLMPVASVEMSGSGSDVARVTWHLLVPGVAEVTRTVEAYSDVAGFAARTTISSLAPVVLSGYTLDEVSVGDASTTIHAMRAGADWRTDEGWKPTVSVGDAHTGDWRATQSAARGVPNSGPGEWISAEIPGGERIALVTERLDYASSRDTYDGAVAAAEVDLSRDVIYIGPLEGDGHAENPTPAPARHRALVPGRPLALERVFTGLGADADDETWQHYKYLTRHRLIPYRKAVVFNTDGVDSNQISTGAKDDVDFTRFLSLVGAARAMGADTFVFDDGWQAISGDWCPDSEPCPEARAPRFPPRFPDDAFAAVRRELAGDPSDPSDDMTLGLWMTPMEFHPSARAFRANPQWLCPPVGAGTVGLNLAQPDSGSSEAGMGVWNPLALGTDPDTGKPERAIDYVERRIRRAIEVYGARYFKFDFLWWADCAGAEPATMYDYHDAFLAMLDDLRAMHPDVTFQIDETNDFRMFPYESIARGPAWFVNGSPSIAELLHNVWDLAPFVPGFALGQRTLKNGQDVAEAGVDAVMAASLEGHLTISDPIDLWGAPRLAQVRKWTDFYKENRETLAAFTYPLLDDPLARGWTALQPWDPDTQEGWLLAYRQRSDVDAKTIALRGVRGDGTYRLTRIDPATGVSEDLGTRSAASLRDGIDVEIARTNGYAIIRVARA